ncbi:MAG: hypothetical protein AAF721_31525 [Myxococcota bacterium]
MRRLLTLSMFLLATGACDPEYGSLRIKEGAGEIDYAFVSDRGIAIEEGKVVVVFAEPISANPNEEYEGLQAFDLQVHNEDVAVAHRGVLRDSFMIVGASPGTTDLDVLIDGRVQETLPVEVRVQGGGQ